MSLILICLFCPLNRKLQIPICCSRVICSKLDIQSSGFGMTFRVSTRPIEVLRYLATLFGTLPMSLTHNISRSLKLPLVFIWLDRNTVHVFYFLNKTHGVAFIDSCDNYKLWNKWSKPRTLAYHSYQCCLLLLQSRGTQSSNTTIELWIADQPFCVFLFHNWGLKKTR